jgi:hypothetical protein
MSHKEQLESTIWDAYKDAYGFRPRHLNLQAMSEPELEALLLDLGEECARADALQVELELAAADRVERTILDLMDAGAKDRAMAVRWLHEAHDTAGDAEYLCFCLGVAYGYFKEQ